MKDFKISRKRGLGEEISNSEGVWFVAGFQESSLVRRVSVVESLAGFLTTSTASQLGKAKDMQMSAKQAGRTAAVVAGVVVLLALLAILGMIALVMFG